MTDWDEAVARLERAVVRLEESADNAARLAAARAAEEERAREIAAVIVARVDAALDKIGQVLGEGGNGPSLGDG